MMQTTRPAVMGAAIGILAGLGALTLAQTAQAADYVVRAQAQGSAKLDAGYSLCGSSDGSLECSEIDHGTGTVTHGGTKISINAQAQSVEHPEASVTSSITADLASATIRQTNSSEFSSGQTSGRLIDQLTFALPDPTSVYELAFSYSFDGTLSGDVLPDGSLHPGLYAQSQFDLGYGDITSTQGIALAGPVYNAPVVTLNNAPNQWVNVVVNPSDYGYTVSGDVLIGGNWGTSLGFQMISTINCGNEAGAATCDYSHTQKFAFGDLPDGVSFTSASGVFLTAPADTTGGVPEPATWALMLGGFGLAGAALRNARRAVTARA